MEKWFSGREFVAARDARRHFGFVRIVIAGSATAAILAARTLDASFLRNDPLISDIMGRR